MCFHPGISLIKEVDALNHKIQTNSFLSYFSNNNYPYGKRKTVFDFLARINCNLCLCVFHVLSDSRQPTFQMNCTSVCMTFARDS